MIVIVLYVRSISVFLSPNCRDPKVCAPWCLSSSRFIKGPAQPPSSDQNISDRSWTSLSFAINVKKNTHNLSFLRFLEIYVHCTEAYTRSLKRITCGFQLSVYKGLSYSFSKSWETVTEIKFALHMQTWLLEKWMGVKKKKRKATPGFTIGTGICRHRSNRFMVRHGINSLWT